MSVLQGIEWARFRASLSSDFTAAVDARDGTVKAPIAAAQVRDGTMARVVKRPRNAPASGRALVHRERTSRPSCDGAEILDDAGTVIGAEFRRAGRKINCCNADPRGSCAEYSRAILQPPCH
jgi:hypothetical protein